MTVSRERERERVTELRQLQREIYTAMNKLARFEVHRCSAYQSLFVLMDRT